MSDPGIVLPTFELTVQDGVVKSEPITYTIPLSNVNDKETLHEAFSSLVKGTKPIPNPPFTFKTEEIAGGGHNVTSINGIKNDDKKFTNWKLFPTKHALDLRHQLSGDIDTVFPKVGDQLTFAYTGLL